MSLGPQYKDKSIGQFSLRKYSVLRIIRIMWILHGPRAEILNAKVIVLLRILQINKYMFCLS
jgi:hypothetical protein